MLLPRTSSKPAGAGQQRARRVCLHAALVLAALGAALCWATLRYQQGAGGPAPAQQRALRQEGQARAQHPLGDPPAANPACRPFQARGLATVAIVGNGPVSSAQRAEIEGRDLVVRFNLMNNWKRLRERVDVWAIRFSTEAASRYWGITNLLPVETDGVLRGLQALWLVGGGADERDWILQRFTLASPNRTMLLPLEPIAAFYQASLNASDGHPSTGFAGTLAAALCAPPSAVLHLYGMNWHPRTWSGHKMDKERAFWEGLVRQGRAVVHPTACYSMRECGGADIDQSCHWNHAGRFMCLLGKPMRWVDRTEALEPERFQDFQQE